MSEATSTAVGLMFEKAGQMWDAIKMKKMRDIALSKLYINCPARKTNRGLNATLTAWSFERINEKIASTV